MKRLRVLFFWLAGLGTLLGGACGISDADRCPSGFSYETSTKTCVLPPDASADTQSDVSTQAPGDLAAPAPGVDTGTTAPSDAGGVDTSTIAASEVGGVTFGAVCSANGQCTSATTNFCLLQPGAAAGYCSKASCTTECPTSYKCCNCAVMGIVACMKDADATAAAAYGCTCS